MTGADVRRIPRLGAGEALGEAALLWVLPEEATETPQALERLLEAIATPERPLLVAGLAVGPSGAPLERYVPRGSQFDLEAMIAAAPQRRMPIRSAHPLNVLIRREAVEAHGLPDTAALGPYAFLEWSRRVLSAACGWYVPGSVVRMPDGPSRPALRDMRAVLRAARTARWSLGETLVAVSDVVRPQRAA